MERLRNRAEFKRMVQRLRDECQTQGLDLAPTAAEELLADHVTTTARRLGIREETFVRGHLRNIDVAGLATSLVRADAEQKREVADTSPAVISLKDTGRLVASLAQAVRCVSRNHERLTGEDSGKWDAIGVLDDASNGLTLLGDALARHHAAPDGVVVLWSDETVVHARRALTQTVENLNAGVWSFGHGKEIDTRVLARMTADLEKLPHP